MEMKNMYGYIHMPKIRFDVLICLIQLTRIFMHIQVVME